MTIVELESQAFKAWEKCIDLQQQAAAAEENFKRLVSKIRQERNQPRFERDAQ